MMTQDPSLALIHHLRYQTKNDDYSVDCKHIPVRGARHPSIQDATPVNFLTSALHISRAHGGMRYLSELLRLVDAETVPVFGQSSGVAEAGDAVAPPASMAGGSRLLLQTVRKRLLLVEEPHEHTAAARHLDHKGQDVVAADAVGLGLEDPRPRRDPLYVDPADAQLDADELGKGRLDGGDEKLHCNTLLKGIRRNAST